MAASISASSGHLEDLHAATNCCAQREWRAHMHLAAQPVPAMHSAAGGTQMPGGCSRLGREAARRAPVVFSIAEVAEEAADGSQAGHCWGPGADALPVAQDLRQRILALPVAHQSQHTPQDIVRQQAQQRTAAIPAKRAERPQADCFDMVVKRGGWS